MPGCMLNEPCFVTETIVTIFSHAMEMGLVFAVIATRKSTILIESESMKKLDLSFVEKKGGGTVWKFHDFSITLILREINF